MTAERMKHLATAVLHDPSNGLARGLLGLVAYNGKWEPPDDVSREAQDDPKRQALMQEYLRRRAKAPDKADDQAKLAAWCDQNGLKAQAVAHYHAVLRLDPRREAAWKHLGFKRSGGRWVKPEQQAAAKHEAERAVPGEQALEAAAGAVARRPGPPRQDAAGQRGGGAGGSDRPRGRADDLGGVRLAWRGGPEDGGPGAGADRCAGVVAGAGDAGGLRQVARGSGRGDAGPPRSRPEGLRADAHRLDPRPDPVRSQAGQRAGEAR